MPVAESQRCTNAIQLENLKITEGLKIMYLYEKLAIYRTRMYIYAVLVKIEDITRIRNFTEYIKSVEKLSQF